MCIIVAKKKGVSVPTFETLKNCFDRNSDGAGFMYLNPKTNKVQIYKGFMEFEDLKEKLDKVYNELGETKDIPFVYHFRIGTSGGNLPENTHPYPLGKNIDNFKKLDFECEIGVAHNGVISDYAPKGENKRKMNDTQLYIYKKMYKYLFHDKYKTDKIKNKISKETGSKFAILDTTGDIQLVGSFIEDNGIMYSNGSYIKYDFNWLDDYNRSYGYYDGFNTNNLLFNNYHEMLEVLQFGEYVKTNKVIYDYDFSEGIIPSNNFEYVELDDKIYFVNWDELTLEVVTTEYEILTEEEYELYVAETEDNIYTSQEW